MFLSPLRASPYRIELLAWVACGALAACDTSSSPPGPVPEEDPTPPANLQIEGSDLLQWDTVTPEFTIEIEGSSATIVGVLASPMGKRRVELRDGGTVQVVAEAGWNLPAAGVLVPSGEIVVCWSAMLGPERSGGRPPHPTRGVALRCRTAGSSGLSDVLDASEGGFLATWMLDVQVRDGQVFLRYLRDDTGWLVLIANREDGTYERTLTLTSTGLTVGDGTLIEPAGASD